VSWRRTICARGALLAIVVTTAAWAATAPPAGAAATKAFDGAQSCTGLTGPDAGRYSCSGIVHTWDGQTDVDVNLFLPSNDPPPGGFPLIGVYHGWGGTKLGLDNRWLSRGYAMFSISDRGWGASCGATDSKRITDPGACANGYNHLLDTRYEVRDAQYLIGLLVDDGIADPDRIGAIGGSYGGGLSMAMAALRDRVMLPDGTLTAWESPDGVPISLAAAVPEIPWTDLANSLQPNGATLDYVADAPYLGPNGDRRIGVLKQSFVAGLYGTGLAASNYAAPGSDPDADLTTWYASINAGEPYDSNPLSADIVDEITSHHSSYYINHSEAPAPLLISNGWTDDLFPPDEAIRFYNRTRTQFPSAQIELMFLDFGHQRGQNKAADTVLLHAKENAWFDYYLLGQGSPPPSGQVEALTKTCPATAASGGPYFAANWAKMARGEVRLDSAAAQTILPAAGDPTVAQPFDPIVGGRACATASGANQPGAASYRLGPAPAGGFTTLGSPTVVAHINSPGPFSQVAARLLDVAPDGTETLVARGTYRPEVSSGTAATRQVFQLHPVGWRFEQGHVAKLELLPQDAPYTRVSNGQLPVSVSNLELRLPVLEAPRGTLIQTPAPKVLPPGYALAADFRRGR
jgi:dienelactone hydrolase